MTQLSIKFQAQAGAVLVTSLVLLTIVTLLAITSMGTNILEEKMAANSQEVNRAFQAAEAGLAKILADDNAFDTNNKVDDNGTPFDPDDDVYDYPGPGTLPSDVGSPGIPGTPGFYLALVDFSAAFRQKTVPKRSAQGWNAAVYSFYHFDLLAEGVTGSGISTELHAGAYQVGPK